jgi:UDP-N-acetylmuramyl pentapeptide phosphotransferase/UDP-N-acetylglucosamine-1-phosphate transferase
MKTLELPSDETKKSGRSRASRLLIHLCQLLLIAVGVWWAYVPAGSDLAQMQIPGFLIALAISWWLVPEIRARAMRLGLVDQPGDDRRIHKVAVPRLGGVAIYISVLATIVALVGIAGRLPQNARGQEGILAIAVGGTLVFVLGLMDDLESIKAKYKLFTQILAGCAAYALGVRIKAIPIPQDWNFDFFFIHIQGGVPIDLGLLSLPITVLWLVGVANAVNLIDGMDGLAAGVSAISALTIWAVALGVAKPFAALMAAVIAGALLGFLRWNFNPARIFLGDSGAYLTGFILAAISITGVIKGAASTVMVPTSLLVLFILAFPLLDTSWAIVRRLAKRVSPFSPDRLHIHHRLLDSGLDQKKVAYIIYSVSAVFGFIAACFVHQEEYFLKLFGSVLLLALFFAEVLNRHRQRGKTVIKKSEGAAMPPAPGPTKDLDSSPSAASAAGEES